MLATLREPALTVTVEFAVSANEPAAMSRELEPRNVKLPFQTLLSAGRVKALETSNVAPDLIVNTPVPSAFTLPRTRVPCDRVVPPEWVLAEKRVHLPVPVFASAVLFVTLLSTMAPES